MQHRLVVGKGCRGVPPAPALPCLPACPEWWVEQSGAQWLQRQLLAGTGDGRPSPAELFGHAQGRRCQETSLEPPPGEGAGEQDGSRGPGGVGGSTGPA